MYIHIDRTQTYTDIHTPICVLQVHISTHCILFTNSFMFVCVWVNDVPNKNICIYKHIYIYIKIYACMCVHICVYVHSHIYIYI